MQGHPESPQLWEKHADTILCELGLTPTVHEPCLYSGIIDVKHIVFMRQVDDFAIAAPDQQMANILLDMLDNKLTMPIKCQGLLDMFNGVDVIQTRNYVKKLTVIHTSTHSAQSTLTCGSTKSLCLKIVRPHFQQMALG
jgi:hypothetical protein